MTYDKKRKLKAFLPIVGYVLVTVLLLAFMVYAWCHMMEENAASQERMKGTLNKCLEGSQEACRECSTWSGDWGISCRDMLIRERFGR